MLQTDFPDYDPSIAQMFGDQPEPTSSLLDFMGLSLFNGQAVLDLIIRFGFNLLICWIIVNFFYYRKSVRRDFYFTFILFSVTVFLLIFLLGTARLQIGMALGLFAIFGIIRYRTEQVLIREMTYLFIVIGLSVINGLSKSISIAELVIANLFFIGAIAVWESPKILKHISTKIVIYEKIEMILPEKSEELKKDLEKRIGINIIKFEIGHVDFLKDIAYIKVYYHPEGNEANTIDTITKLKDFS